MKKVLIAYYSLHGHTEAMAQYIAEGVRISGQEATVKKISELKKVEDIKGYDGYIFGSPTFHLEMAGPMKNFLFLAADAGLEGKLAGAFGSYTHTGNAPQQVLDDMEYVFKMKPFSLNAFKLLEHSVPVFGSDSLESTHSVETSQGMHDCQDYGKTFGQELGD